MARKALITGINGQDGSYLAEFLLGKGYEVVGIVRRESLEDAGTKLRNIGHLRKDVDLCAGSITDHVSFYKIFHKVMPDECYHLASFSFVDYSFETEHQVMSTNFQSTHYILSTIRELRPDCKFLLAGSSEMFGEPDASPQTEATRFNPKTIYGISKVASHYLVKNYRGREGTFACTAIMYNHESPRRGDQFVTKKIARAAAQIKAGRADRITLGNVDALRDWGYAPDYVQGMWAMLNHPEPDDYILATGLLHSVRDFLDVAFSHLGLDYRRYLHVDPALFRASERVPLQGDAGKAAATLGWTPRKPFADVVREMVESEVRKD